MAVKCERMDPFQRFSFTSNHPVNATIPVGGSPKADCTPMFKILLLSNRFFVAKYLRPLIITFREVVLLFWKAN